MERLDEITIEEATAFIEEWPDQDEYVNSNYVMFMRYGEADDNSIELFDYWKECKYIVEKTVRAKS